MARRNLEMLERLLKEEEARRRAALAELGLKLDKVRLEKEPKHLTYVIFYFKITVLSHLSVPGTNVGTPDLLPLTRPLSILPHARARLRIRYTLESRWLYGTTMTVRCTASAREQRQS